jgi:UbiA prenyltransferase family
MSYLYRGYLLINVLSLDVAAGAVVSALFFGWVFAVHLLPWGLLCLGLSVWIIYTVDHLVDASRTIRPAATARHRFHQRYFSLLSAGLLVAVTGLAVSLLFVRRPVLYSGLALSIFVLAYILTQRYLIYLKEVCGGLLYCLGVLLPAWSLSHEAFSLRDGLIIGQFALTVFSNLILFSIIDFRRDVQDHQHSITTTLGEKNTVRLLSIVFIISGILWITELFLVYYTLSLLSVFALMNLLLLSIFLMRGRFKSNERFRLLGDAIFYIPLLILV